MFSGSLSSNVNLRTCSIRIGILMEQLEANDPHAAQIVDLHHFAGFTLDEIATNIGLKPRKVRHLWTRGSNWLRAQMVA